MGNVHAPDSPALVSLLSTPVGHRDERRDVTTHTLRTKHTTFFPPHTHTHTHNLTMNTFHILPRFVRIFPKPFRRSSAEHGKTGRTTDPGSARPATIIPVPNSNPAHDSRENILHSTVFGTEYFFHGGLYLYNL